MILIALLPQTSSSSMAKIRVMKVLEAETEKVRGRPNVILILFQVKNWRFNLPA